MQFRFLGWQDCPDWLLAQICEFSSLSSVRFKGLCQLSVDFLLKKDVAEEDVARFVSEHNDVSSIRRFLYSVSYMMRSAASYNCEADDFEKECTHLGLPPEHSKMLARVYTSNLDVLKEYVKNSIPKDAPLESVTLTEENGPNPILRYTLNGKETVCQLTREQLSTMRSEIKFVRDMISAIFTNFDLDDDDDDD